MTFGDLFEAIASLILIYIVLDISGVVSPSQIPGIFSVPEYPIFGNILQVWNNPALVFINWSQKFKISIFQIRLGNRRIVVVNSYEDIKNLWEKHSTANNSRPITFTFHDIVSISQGLTVGSTPAGVSFQKKKKTVAQALTKKKIDEEAELLDQETKYTIKKLLTLNNELRCEPSNNIFYNLNTRFSDIDLLKYGQMFALRSSINLTYGIKLSCFGNDAHFSEEIIEVESQIIRLRSPISNIQDYLSILRIWPFKVLTNSKKALYWRDQRDKYMNSLYKTLTRRLKADNEYAKKSMMGQILSKNDRCLTDSEIQSICLTMVSAGLDNTSLNFNHLMGHLSHPEYGYSIQQIAFKELLKAHNNSLLEAWFGSANTMNCDYITAMVKECLRFFTVLPLNLPRVTTKPIHYKNFVIPEQTILFMNAFAANHDESVFPNPYEYNPDRWLDPSTKKIKSHAQLNHLSFGTGSRKCSGNNLAMRELYTLVARMILTFQIKKPIDDSMLMDLDPFKSNSFPSATSFEPKVFKVRLRQRRHQESNQLYKLILK